MNLGELVSMLKEAQVLDSKCTAREVTTFFVMVNIDDELYANAGRSRWRARCSMIDSLPLV